MRLDGTLNLTVDRGNGYQDHAYSSERVAAVLDGAGGGSTARTTMTATYSTTTVNPTVYYTGLYSNGNILTARTTSGITYAAGLYRFIEDTTNVTDFIAVWDEGNVNDYVSEWIVVDT